MAKKYYWLRLKDDWFNSKVIKKLRKIAGGDTYTIIYLKMQLLSLKNEGKLYFDGIEDTFAEELALELDEEVDNVSVTISFLQKSGLLEITDDDGVLLTAVPEAIGSEAASTERSRRCRANKKISEQKALQCNTEATMCNTDIDIEKEVDKETKERTDNTICAEQASAPEASEPEPIITLPLNTGEEYPFYENDITEFSSLYPAVDVLQALRSMKGWCMTNPAKRKTKKGIRRFVNSWLSREQDKGGTHAYSRTMNQNSGSHVEQYAAGAREWANE